VGGRQLVLHTALTAVPLDLRPVGRRGEGIGPRRASSAAISPTQTEADVPKDDDGGTAADTRRWTSNGPVEPASRTASASSRCSAGSSPTVKVTPTSTASTTTRPSPGVAVASTDTPGSTARLHTRPCPANQVSVQPPTSQTRTGTSTVTRRDTPAVSQPVGTKVVRAALHVNRFTTGLPSVAGGGP
jgi:hypothetical protein